MRNARFKMKIYVKKGEIQRKDFFFFFYLKLFVLWFIFNRPRLTQRENASVKEKRKMIQFFSIFFKFVQTIS